MGNIVATELTVRRALLVFLEADFYHFIPMSYRLSLFGLLNLHSLDCFYLIYAKCPAMPSFLRLNGSRLWLELGCPPIFDWE